MKVYLLQSSFALQGWKLQSWDRRGCLTV